MQDAGNALEPRCVGFVTSTEKFYQTNIGMDLYGLESLGVLPYEAGQQEISTIAARLHP